MEILILVLIVLVIFIILIRKMAPKKDVKMKNIPKNNNSQKVIFEFDNSVDVSEYEKFNKDKTSQNPEFVANLIKDVLKKK